MTYMLVNNSNIFVSTKHHVRPNIFNGLVFTLGVFRLFLTIMRPNLWRYSLEVG